MYLVGKKIVKISIKSTVRAQRTDTKRKTRLVYLDENVTPWRGKGEGKPLPRLGEEV